MYNNARDFEKSDCNTAILPVGALEQHGSHLPVGTDTIIANELAMRLSKEINAYCLPVIPIANSIEHRNSKGTVYILSKTLMDIIKDIANSLEFSGFKRLIVLSTHGGNWVIKPAVRELNRELKSLEVISISTMTVATKRLHEVMKNTQNDVHAGEKETSIIKYLFKDCVADIREEKDKKFVPQDYLDYFDTADVTYDGYWGYPEDATSEKGSKMLDLYVECAVDYINKLDEFKNRMNPSENV